LNSFFARKFVIQGIFIAVAVIIALRLFYLQVIDDSAYLSAHNNVLRKVDVYPARGVILDRNNRILVQNEPVYDVLVTPREVKELDTALFCELVHIDTSDFRKRLEKARSYSPYKASIFIKRKPTPACRSIFTGSADSMSRTGPYGATPTALPPSSWDTSARSMRRILSAPKAFIRWVTTSA
jgi:cell division protein FtsI/penicillin-binding protein 2